MATTRGGKSNPLILQRRNTGVTPPGRTSTLVRKEPEITNTENTDAPPEASSFDPNKNVVGSPAANPNTNADGIGTAIPYALVLLSPNKTGDTPAVAPPSRIEPMSDVDTSKESRPANSAKNKSCCYSECCCSWWNSCWNSCCEGENNSPSNTEPLISSRKSEGDAASVGEPSLKTRLVGDAYGNHAVSNPQLIPNPPVSRVV